MGKEKRIILALRSYFASAKRKKAVIGISGGVDSALTALLAVRAIGSKNVIGVLLPSSFTPKKDMEDARELCRMLKIRKIEINAIPLANATAGSLPMKLKPLSFGNLIARLRMLILYALANEENALVIGTGDKSEISIGYFTKYGDGACDILPIGNLYKTEAISLAKKFGIPPSICNKSSSPRLWKGHSAKGELGAEYEEIDSVLSLIEKGKKPKGKFARSIAKRIRESRHKRIAPPVV